MGDWFLLLVRHQWLLSPQWSPCLSPQPGGEHLVHYPLSTPLLSWKLGHFRLGCSPASSCDKVFRMGTALLGSGDFGHERGGGEPSTPLPCPQGKALKLESISQSQRFNWSCSCQNVSLKTEKGGWGDRISEFSLHLS